MTSVEHYALSLAYYGVLGFLLGIGFEAVEASNQGKGRSGDLLYLGGILLIVGYGIAAFKFVDGRYLMWIIPLLVAFGGSVVGKGWGSSRHDPSVRLVLLAAYASVPLIYHLAVI